MTFKELTQTRFSVRQFKDTPVSEADLKNILAVAVNAPSACNKQPIHVYVAQTPGALAKVRPCTQCHFNAPLLLVITYDRSLSWHWNFDGADYGPVDCAIAATQMMLEITALGLGSTFVGWFDPARLAKALDFSDDIIPIAILPVGHPADGVAPAVQHHLRHPLSELATMM